MQFVLVLLAIFFNYVRVKSKDDALFLRWRYISIAGIIFSVVFFFICAVSQRPKLPNYLVVYPVALFIMVQVFRLQELRSLKSRLYIFLPLIIVGFLNDTIRLISATLARSSAAYFVAGSIFSVIWLVVASIINSRQQKALQRERQIAEDKEKELRITEKVMAQLEEQVNERTAALRQQKEELEKTIGKLHSTQMQLVHAEKMASLGELTAGIAHEIQNPLNFVNNFSDLSKELIDEMNDELEKGDVEEAKFIAADIRGNLEKINHHGKRADSIVRGMLQHSRTGKGEKQETDINKLADEYLRLSYHGLRSKDKDFNADIVANFDDSIGMILIAPQEIGRVILNLVNNAFYAVHERSKTTAEAGYKPYVSVVTKRNDNIVTISISDNGDGISEKIKDKIFNPFFTTKPTGQGTGLGLSLSYDIVKAHGGELTMESKEGAGTAFKIVLPI